MVEGVLIWDVGEDKIVGCKVVTKRWDEGAFDATMLGKAGTMLGKEVNNAVSLRNSDGSIVGKYANVLFCRKDSVGTAVMFWLVGNILNEREGGADAIEIVGEGLGEKVKFLIT